MIAAKSDRIVTVCAVLVVLIGSAIAQGPPPGIAWVKRGGGPTEDYGWAVDLDGTNNLVVAGHFTGPAEFDGASVTPRGGIDIYLARYDVSGKLLWVAGAGGPGDDEARAVAIDEQGRSYLTGSFTSPAAFGTESVESSATGAFFLAQHDREGRALWVRKAAGTGRSEGHAVAVDRSGHIYAAGFFTGTAIFETTSLTSRGVADVFLVKYDSAGRFLWARCGGGAQGDDAGGVAVDPSGAVIVTGTFKEAAIFDGQTLTSFGGGDIFLAKYGADGGLLWIRNMGGADVFGVDTGFGVAADFAGNIYVTGSFTGSARFGGVTLPHAGGGDLFVAKFSTSGDMAWARGFGNSGPDQGHSVKIDPNGDCYVAGFIFDTVNFDGQQLSSPSHADAFAAKFDPSGRVLWAAQAGGTAYKSANGLAVSLEGTCFLTGFFRGTTAFGPFILTNNFTSNRDVYIARLNTPRSAPRLDIQNGDGQAVLSWPATATNFGLESTAQLAPRPDWASVTNATGTAGDRFTLTNITVAPRFYRLRGLP